MIVWSYGTTEYFSTDLLASEVVNADGDTINPTGDPVEFAFRRITSTAPLTWQAGAWLTLDTTPLTYRALILVGPANGGVNLAAGTYRVWRRITDTVEVPVQDMGLLCLQA